jgi:hypothetical protein
VLRIRIPDPHYFGKLDPDPIQSGKLDPDPNQNEKHYPDPQQVTGGSFSEGRFVELEGTNLGESEW